MNFEIGASLQIFFFAIFFLFFFAIFCVENFFFAYFECKIIKIACTEFIKADVNRIEKNWAAIDYSIADGKDLTKKERQKIAKEIRKELLSDYNKEQIKEDLIKAEKYESYKRSLYMLK